MTRANYNKAAKLGNIFQHGEVSKLIISGLTNSEIAMRIGRTEHSVKQMVKKIYDTSGMSNRVEFAMWYSRRFPIQSE